MRKAIAILSLAMLSAPLPAADNASAPDRVGIEFFEAKVRPILVDNCYKCHSAGAEKLKGNLRVDNREGLLKGGDSGPVIVPGQPEKSLLLKAINHDPASDLDMPPKSKLPDPVIADLTRWIRLGAPMPEEKAATALTAVDHSADYEKVRKEHWAFQPLKKPVPPTVKDIAWTKTPIDNFILAKLEDKGIKPAPPADKRTLLRRIYLDLIGLPPTPTEQDAFLQNTSPDALANVVDDLLSRPQYGERWARHWLDVVRFAESQGYERDEPKPFAWRFRDYVINAFNQDKPYDRFLTEQLAGDEIENSNAETQTAASFLRLGPFDTIAADGKLARYDQLDDVVGTTTAAFLGQTLRCARCHDHKFEPFAQTDYYKFLAVFDPLSDKVKEASLVGNAEERAAYATEQSTFDAQVAPLEAKVNDKRLEILQSAKKPNLGGDILGPLNKPIASRSKGDLEQLAKNRRRIDDELKRIATREQIAELDQTNKQIDEINAKRPLGTFAYVFSDEPKPRTTRLFIRGDCNKEGPEIRPGVPTVLGGNNVSPPKPLEKSSGRRLWLANWMTGPGQPLVARVMANRIWQYHFGAGIVSTANDLGVHGDPPTHPELLEYLAASLVENKWTLKQLHKTIILSSAYQTSSAHQTNPADVDGHLLAYWHTRRLESEVIRDSILAVSGKLNLQSFGPGIFPPLAEKVVGQSAGFDWSTSDERQSARRSIYVHVKRNVNLPELEVLGLPDAASSTDRRTQTTTALQSLMLLNSKFTNQQAAHLADRIREDAGSEAPAQVDRAFQLTLCRPPLQNERDNAIKFLEQQSRFPSSKDKQMSPLTSLCLVLLNTNEFIYTN